MRRATFLVSVRADLLDILTYVSEQSGSVAIGEIFVKKLRAQCHKLAGLGGTIGRARPELRGDCFGIRRIASRLSTSSRDTEISIPIFKSAIRDPATSMMV